MKNQHTLLMLALSSILIACGSGGSGGSSGSTPTTPNSNLPKNYEVPNNLKDAVEKTMQIKIDWQGAIGYKPMSINGREYDTGEQVNFSQFNLGYSENTYTFTNKRTIEQGKFRIYRMPYSVVFSFIADKNSVKYAPNYHSTEKFDDVLAFKPGVGGYYTDKDTPTTGTATYQGIAFIGNEKGTFNLDVDFAKKTTEGKITNLAKNDIILEKGKIQPVGINENEGPKKMGFIGNAKLNGDYAYLIKGYTPKNGKVIEDKGYSYDYHKYSGHFFGPKAEEVAGTVYGSDKSGYHDDNLVSFGGQRGEIKK